MRVLRRRWPRGLQPLGMPLVVALLLHSLLLAGASLRPQRTGAAPPLRPDDTPELLVFSRLPPEPLPTSEVPLPPPELLPAPPPPPSLPTRPTRPLRPSGQSLASATRRLSQPRRPSPARASRAVRPRPATPATAPSAPAPSGSASASPSASATASASASASASATTSATTSGATPASPGKPEAGPRWRRLWQGAEGGAALPPPPAALAAALAVAPPQAELRRLPLQRARQEGVEPDSGLLLRLDGHRLLLWIEGGDLWLLRTPA